MTEPNEWAGQALSFRREQPIEDQLRNVEWITIHKDDGTEEHWPVQVDEVTTHSDGTVSVKTKALTASDND